MPSQAELKNRWVADHGHDHAYSRGRWWRYANGAWSPVPTNAVKQSNLRSLDGDVAVTNHLVNEVTFLAELELYRPDAWDPERSARRRVVRQGGGE